MREDLAAQMEAWRDEKGLVKDSEAIRRLIESALEAKQAEPEPPRRQRIAAKAAWGLALAALVVAPWGVAYWQMWVVAGIYLLVALLAEGVAEGAIWRADEPDAPPASGEGA